MKKIAVLILVCAFIPLAAQPVFTEEDLMDPGYQATFLSDTARPIAVDVGNSGGTQNWDFTREFVGIENHLTVLFPAGTPKEDDFPEADLVQYTDKIPFSDTTSGEVWVYTQTTSDAVLHLGDYAEAEVFDTTVELFDDRIPDGTIIPLPLQMYEEWEDSFYRADTLIADLNMHTETWTISHYQVDAYGTVYVPAGTFEALRVVSYDTVIIHATIIVPQDPDTSETITYTWYAADVGTVARITSQDNETDPEFTEASEYMVLTDYYGIAEDTQPVDVTTLNVAGDRILFTNASTGNVKVEIYDALGRRTTDLYSGNLPAGTHSLPIPERLTAGVYFLRVLTPVKTLSAKFVVLD